MHIYPGILAALSATLILKIATVVPALILADIMDNLATSAASSQLLLGAFTCYSAIDSALSAFATNCPESTGLSLNR